MAATIITMTQAIMAMVRVDARCDFIVSRGLRCAFNQQLRVPALP